MFNMCRRWGRTGALAVILMLMWSKAAKSSESPIIESMGDKQWCEKYSSEIHWISEKTSALISGRPVDYILKCQLIFGLATAKENARLRLHFEFIFIQDCDVQLQINESFTSDFTQSHNNKEMFMAKCNMINPGPMFAQPKNFVLITLLKENIGSKAYNFRLNISMAEEIPQTGPKLHVIIIIGFVLVVVVGMAAILLFKYVQRVTSSWHERQVEEAMTRAINIYNSQEPLEEPDLVYIRPGDQGSRATVSNSNNHHPHHRGPSGSEIAFVHSDGRIERFRPLDLSANQNKQKPKSNTTKSRRHSHEPTRTQSYINCDDRMTSSQPAAANLNSVPLRDHSSRSDQNFRGDQSETVSLGGIDVPPSYEEALEMPAPGAVKNSVRPREMAVEEEEEEVAERARLEVDYFNVGWEDGDAAQAAASDDHRDRDGDEACGSGEALLSFTERKAQS